MALSLAPDNSVGDLSSSGCGGRFPRTGAVGGSAAGMAWGGALRLEARAGWVGNELSLGPD